MTTNDNGISKEYQASQFQPWRTYVERYTLVRLTGDVAPAGAAPPADCRWSGNQSMLA